MRPRRERLAAPVRRACAFALLFAASCARCGGPGKAASAEELLARGAPGSVVTAPLGVVAQHARELLERAAKLPGGEQLSDTRNALAAQLGFDPLTRDGLVAAGLDPERVAAASLLVPAAGRGSWIAALPLSKPEAFLQTFDRLARERAGYASRTDEERAGAKIAVYGREGTAGRLAVAVTRGYGLVARAEDPAAEIALAAGREAGDSLARDAQLKAIRDRLGAQDVIVYAPQGSPIPRRFTQAALPGDVGVGVSGSSSGLAVRLVSALAAKDAQRVKATLPGGGGELVELLPPDAPVRARLGVAPRELYEEAQSLPWLAELLRRAGIAADAFAALEPGAAVSLALRPDANLGAALDYGLDFRHRSPFQTLQLVALAQVRDEAQVRKALASIVAALPGLGGQVRKAGPDDYAVTYEGGEGARFGLFRVEGKLLAYALGGGLSPQDLHRSPKTASPEAAALYSGQGFALLADFGRLAGTVRALPESAYGTGPQSYVARSLVSQIIEPLGAVRVEASAFPAEGGLTAELVIGLSPP